MWRELPGGDIEDGETYLEAAIRELRERLALPTRQHTWVCRRGGEMRPTRIAGSAGCGTSRW